MRPKLMMPMRLMKPMRLTMLSSPMWSLMPMKQKPMRLMRLMSLRLMQITINLEGPTKSLV